jgi:micrococcal nuclease
MKNRRTYVFGLILSSLMVVALLAACTPSSYGGNTETQVAQYLTQTVPTARAAAGYPTLAPVPGGGDTTGGIIGGAPTQVPQASIEEEMRVASVTDGDTLQLEDGRSVRLIGMNTPEIGQPYYNEATQYAASLVQGQVVGLAYDVQRVDQFGRTLAYVYVGDLFVNLEIVRAGYANAYTVQPNSVYSAAFLDAEREARNAARGLWTPSVVPLNITSLNPTGEEWVEVTNEGGDIVEVTGFTLKDEANHIFTFPQLILLPGGSVRVYTGVGMNTTDTLFWGLAETVWNDDGDAAFLRDPTGAIVDTFSY